MSSSPDSSAAAEAAYRLAIVADQAHRLWFRERQALTLSPVPVAQNGRVRLLGDQVADCMEKCEPFFKWLAAVHDRPVNVGGQIAPSATEALVTFASLVQLRLARLRDPSILDVSNMGNPLPDQPLPMGYIDSQVQQEWARLALRLAGPPAGSPASLPNGPLSAGEIRLGENVVDHITPSEMALFVLLWADGRCPDVLHEEAIQAIWGSDSGRHDEALIGHMKRLRRKLQAATNLRWDIRNKNATLRLYENPGGRN
jgi:hypothetical protein